MCNIPPSTATTSHPTLSGHISWAYEQKGRNYINAPVLCARDATERRQILPMGIIRGSRRRSIIPAGSRSGQGARQVLGRGCVTSELSAFNPQVALKFYLHLGE